MKATATTNDIGWFSALASTYGIDRTRERVRPGAFTQTIEGWRASGKHLPVHYDHEGDGDPFIICQ